MRKLYENSLYENTCRQELLVDENIDLDIAYLKAVTKEQERESRR